MRKALVKTKALYSGTAYKNLDLALRIKLDVNDPNGDEHHEFIKQSEKAIEEMSKDIQANMSNWFKSLTRLLQRSAKSRAR
jgi:hypothetical protein